MVDSVKDMIVSKTIARMMSDTKTLQTNDVLMECAKNISDSAAKYYVINSLTQYSYQFRAMWDHSTPRRREFWVNYVNAMIHKGIELHSLFLNS